MKRIACYVRVSTEEQKKGLSIDSQIKALEDYCKANSERCAGIYNDAGMSARKRYKTRPALLQLIQDCKDGKIDLICFTRLDRWFRSVADYYEVQAILDECHVPWRAIWEDYETETAAGIFKVNIMLSVAQSEADRTRERVRATMRYKAERGDYLGAAPKGYIKRNSQLYIDETKYDGIKAIFTTYLETKSIMKAISAAEEHGVTTDMTHIHAILRNPCYSGTTKNGYHCPAYITKEEQDTIISMMSKRERSPRNINRVYMFAGLCRCSHCGGLMTGCAYPNHSGVYYNFYRCVKTYSSLHRCPRLEISEGNIEKYLLENLDTIMQDEIERIEAHNRQNPYRKERKRLENKLSRLKIMFEEGDISLDDYREKRDSIKDRLELLPEDYEPVPKPIPKGWKDIYNSLDKEHKKIFWNKIIKYLEFDAGDKYHPVIHFQ